MASPFTAKERIKILQIAGIPSGATTLNVNALFLYPFSNVDAWQTNFFSTGDLGPIVAALDHILNEHTDTDTADAVRECFDDWDSVKFSETQIVALEGGTNGPLIFNSAAKRHEIRRYVANLLGFFIPEDGYLHEAEAVLGRSLSEFRKGNGGR